MGKHTITDIFCTNNCKPRNLYPFGGKMKTGKCSECGAENQPVYEDDLGRLFCDLCAEEVGLFNLEAENNTNDDYSDLNELCDEETRYESKGGK